MNEIVYLPNQNETAIAFVNRVVAEQSDREPLRIVVQLLEISWVNCKVVLVRSAWRHRSSVLP